MLKIYSVIGDECIDGATKIAIKTLAPLFDKTWTLRVTGEYGVAEHFEKAHNGMSDVYLPWPGYNGRDSNLCEPTMVSRKEASTHIKTWDSLNEIEKVKAASVVQVILGLHCRHKSTFILHSSKQYNMKLVRSIAKKYNIPMINMSKTTHFYDIKNRLEKI